MATVTGFTAARMKEIEDSSVVSGAVNAGYDLILTKRDGSEINAGYVRGQTGANGADAQAVMSIEDSDTLDLTLSGVGTVANPWKISGKTRYGTTAERNAAFPDPAANASKVALANRQIIWFNTDHGWYESYYTTVATGLLVPILIGGAVSGWYPIANGPQANLTGAGPQSHVNGSYFTNWQNFGTGGSFRNSTLITRTAGSSTLQTNLAGRYDIEVAMQFPNGSGIGVWEFDYDGGNSAGATLTQNPVSLLASFGQFLSLSHKDLLLGSGSRCYMRTSQATWSVGNVLSWMSMRYVGPPIATR